MDRCQYFCIPGKDWKDGCECAWHLPFDYPIISLKAWEVKANDLIFLIRQEDRCKFLILIVTGSLVIGSLVPEVNARKFFIVLLFTSCNIRFLDE